MNVYEMDGFLRGKCLPGDIKVNESTAEYLARKINAASELEGEVTALVATLEKCKEITNCPSEIDLQDHLKQLVADSVQQRISELESLHSHSKPLLSRSPALDAEPQQPI